MIARQSCNNVCGSGICLVFRKSEPHYAYRCYAYKKKNMLGPSRKIGNFTQQIIMANDKMNKEFGPHA